MVHQGKRAWAKIIKKSRNPASSLSTPTLCGRRVRRKLLAKNRVFCQLRCISLQIVAIRIVPDLTNFKMLTPLQTSNNITLSYKYQSNQEYVFSCRGQPFVTSISQDQFPPSSTLIDFQLVRDFKLKLKNVQCQKITFAGFKMRIALH